MSNQHEQLWSRCLSVIKDNLSESLYSTWFAPIVALQYENNIIVLQVPSQFFVEFIEEKYIDLLRKEEYIFQGNSQKKLVIKKSYLPLKLSQRNFQKASCCRNGACFGI